MSKFDLFPDVSKDEMLQLLMVRVLEEDRLGTLRQSDFGGQAVNRVWPEVVYELYNRARAVHDAGV